MNECLKFLSPIALVMLLTSVSLGETPFVMSYQGQLLDDSGTPIDRDIDIVFQIYDDPKDGNLVWSERQTVSVRDGLFDARLGENEEFLIDPDIFRTATTYLAVEIDGQEITRGRLVASPYAIRAGTSDNADVAQTADFFRGQPPSDFAQSTHSHVGEDVIGGTLPTSVYDAYQDLFDAGYLNNVAVNNLLTQEQLDGRFSALAHGHDAADLTSGTISNDRYVAINNLFEYGYLDGNDNFDLLNRIQSDLRFAAINHSHTGFEIYGELSSGGYIDGINPTDLLTLGQGDTRYAAASHTHPAPARSQADFHFSVRSFASSAVISSGVIAADGSIRRGFALNSCFWDATMNRYELFMTFAGDYNLDDYITHVTVLASTPHTVVTNSYNGRLHIYIYRL